MRTLHDKNKTLLSAKKAQGTLEKVSKMIEEDAYCPDIIQQVDAVVGLLKATKCELLRGHLEHCLEERIKEDKDSTITELISIYNLNHK